MGETSTLGKQDRRPKVHVAFPVGHQFRGRVAPRACGGDAFVYSLTQCG